MELPLNRYGVRYCTRCVMPETKPGIAFDERGWCNACVAEENMAGIDYAGRGDALGEIACKARRAAEERGLDYDCVVPVSGGKDSTYQCYYARDVLGLRVLGVYVRPLVQVPRGYRNQRNLSRQFPTFVFHIPDEAWELPRKLWESLEDTGKPLQPYDDILYTIPEGLAERWGIPLVIRGENSRVIYGNPPEPAQNYEDVRSTCIYLSDYMYWDSEVIARFAIDKGLETRGGDERELLGSGGYWDFEQLDDVFPIVSHRFKYAKFGYGRATDQACRDIRWGKLTRDEAIPLIHKYDGKIANAHMWKYINYCGKTWDDMQGQLTKWTRVFK